MNETLFDRTARDGKHFGLDELDILYWHLTTNLLSGVPQQRAVAVMDEFINSHGEKLISDPLKRALLQRDMWELFDWSAGKFVRTPDESKARRELQLRIAKIIRRLALTTNEIASLPDNYAQTEAKGLADLPRGLFKTNGDWVNLGNGYGVSIAPTHTESFEGHSAFYVMLHVPEGRKAALDYLDALRDFAKTGHAWVYVSNRMVWISTNEPTDMLVLSTNIPVFPNGTEWALVRRLCVIDTEGRIQPSPITESIQMRRYLDVRKRIPDPRFETNHTQILFEFEMDKRSGGALRAVAEHETDFNFVHFRSQGHDLFEENYRNEAKDGPIESSKLQSEVLMTCRECHSAPGIHSVLTYTGFLEDNPTRRPAYLEPADCKLENNRAISWIRSHYNWGLLQGLWAQDD